MADLLRSILSRKPLLIWGDLRPEDLDFLMSELPHRGLAINAVVASVEEAHAIWDTASRLRSARGPSRLTSQSGA